MKYAEAIAAGWRESDIKLTRCYVSRKNFVRNDAECYPASGNRSGQMYYLAPNWKSSNYSLRCYLIKED